jgi:hypothetical protein
LLDSENNNESFKISRLGERISKTGNILNNSANIQIEEFQKQVQQNSFLYEKLIKNLIIDNFDTLNAFDTCKEFFNKESINFVAIDGTEYATQFFDMVLFYAGAYSCPGILDFNKDDNSVNIKANYEEKFLDKGKEISSCVPIFINKIPEIDTSFYDSQNQYNSLLNQFTEEGIIDNTNISKSLMTFSEFFLAYTMASTSQTDVIFMDRSLSNMYSSLLTDTSKRSDWSETCSLLNFDIDDILFDINDFTIARHLLYNRLLEIPPSRGDYLRYSIFFKILENEYIDLPFLCKLLNIDYNDEKRIKRIEKYLKKWIDEDVIIKENNHYKINEKYQSTWSRIKKLVDIIGNQIFKNVKDPFTIIKNFDGKERKELITTTDLSFLTLFTLYLLIEECWKNNILLIGITKDTIARDFSNHLLPVGIENSLWDINQTNDDDDGGGGGGEGGGGEGGSETNKNNVNDTIYSDRMLLQTVSLLNYENLNIPWSLIEYDSAFVMTIPDTKKRKGYVSGAIKNKITTNKLFLRSFVQLGQAKSENRLRSNVLFIDRLVYPPFDIQNSENIAQFMHEYSSEEKIDFILYKDNKTPNQLQNLVISILKSMSCPSIAESFGHNKSLYIADKVAKWHNEEFRKIVDSTTFLISNKKNLRNFLFYMNTFREKRYEYESNR